MSTVATFAEQDPERIAVIWGNGEKVETYGELERRSRRLAHVLRRTGVEPGGCVALLMGNEDEFFDFYWACHRTGLFFTPVNWHLQEDEVRYIVENSDADVFVASARFAEVAARVAPQVPKARIRLGVGGEIEGFRPIEAGLAEVPEELPLENPVEGSLMLYSSGTTGRPKGVRRPLPGKPAGDPALGIGARLFLGLFGIGEEDRYLVPAPLYHAAPLMFSAALHRIGAAAVVMRRFDAEEALRIIQEQRVTASQWVPTHFQRLLQLPAEVRARYDVSSLRVAIHAAAPCPIPIKQAMIDWWGDAILEYYGGTEGGGTLIRAQEWLTHKGSVGRHWSGGTIHIQDEEGDPLTEPGQEGVIYFEGPESPEERFRYYKDDEKTRDTYRGRLFTMGDIGYVDADGYLFLTDRQSNMIISGGVNIYPQEAESHLITHPAVDDVAVIGVPNPEMGEEVKAVVIPADGAIGGPALEAELIEFCRQNLAHYKCPRSIDFVDSLPRTATGKMAKRKLRERYWKGRESRIV